MKTATATETGTVATREVFETAAAEWAAAAAEAEEAADKAARARARLLTLVGSNPCRIPWGPRGDDGSRACAVVAVQERVTGTDSKAFRSDFARAVHGAATWSDVTEESVSVSKLRAVAELAPRLAVLLASDTYCQRVAMVRAGRFLD